ncbi:MAG: hypothetical protein NTV49_07600 [Kiritimatiellaeota bacterium]|nr:hypothetical protein [Kiritimatiellota bacterium]
MNYVVITLMVAGLLLTGCGKKAVEKMVEARMAKQGVKAKVDLSGEQVTIQTKDGTSTFSGGKGAKVPDTFPKDVFVYPGATVMASVTVPKGCNLVLETKDDLEKVLGAFKDQMAGAGWKEEMNMNQGGTSMAAYKKDQRTASVVVASVDQKTQITITVAENK